MRKRSTGKGAKSDPDYAYLSVSSDFQYPLTDRRNEENQTPLPASPDADNSNITIPNRSSGFTLGVRAFWFTRSASFSSGSRYLLCSFLVGNRRFTGKPKSPAPGVKSQAFGSGHEVEEIRLLWKGAHQKELLDEDWLYTLPDERCLSRLHVDTTCGEAGLTLGERSREVLIQVHINVSFNP